MLRSPSTEAVPLSQRPLHQWKCENRQWDWACLSDLSTERALHSASVSSAVLLSCSAAAEGPQQQLQQLSNISNTIMRICRTGGTLCSEPLFFPARFYKPSI